MALKVGDRAPDFTLPYAPKQLLSLSEQLEHGPVVLLFFPFAFSSTCTGEICRASDDYSAYADADVRVLGISVDSPYVTHRFAESCGGSVSVLSDFNKEVIRAYDVVRPDLNGLLEVAERVVFIIDRSGTIRYVWQGEHPGVMPPLDEILGVAREIGGSEFGRGEGVWGEGM